MVRCGEYVVMHFYPIPLDNTRAVLGDRRLSLEYSALRQDTISSLRWILSTKDAAFLDIRGFQDIILMIDSMELERGNVGSIVLIASFFSPPGPTRAIYRR